MKTPLLLALLALCGCGSPRENPQDSYGVYELQWKGHAYIRTTSPEGGIIHAAHCPCFGIVKSNQGEGFWIYTTTNVVTPMLERKATIYMPTP